MHSFTSGLMHCVWSTKEREPWLTPELRKRLWPYLGGIAKQNQMKALAVGGPSDHVHVLLSLPSTLSIGKAMQLLKGNSSKWLRETFPKMHSFVWQAPAQTKKTLASTAKYPGFAKRGKKVQASFCLSLAGPRPSPCGAARECPPG
jgi:REP element-mobilizing transposase RayT